MYQYTLLNNDTIGRSPKGARPKTETRATLNREKCGSSSREMLYTSTKKIANIDRHKTRTQIFIDLCPRSLCVEPSCKIPPDENIRARYWKMFPCVSLEAFFKKSQVMIAKYIEECHEIHGCSSIH